MRILSGGDKSGSRNCAPQATENNFQEVFGVFIVT
jgi:hypothetical protein